MTMTTRTKIFSIILIMLAGFYSVSVQAQCTVTAAAYPTTVCAGDPVTLTSTGACGYLMYNDFNNGTAGAGWVATTGVSFSNPCNPTADGTIYMWMGSAVPIPRTLTTIDFNVNGACEIRFDMKYATQSQSSPCEGIDEYDEGITLQYSINGGTSWVDIAYFRPDGVILPNAIAPGSNNTSITNYTTPFTVWDNYSFPVPSAAQTNSTRFRWIQQDYSSMANDHWGLDNIEILCPSNVLVQWSHGPTVFDPPTVYPTSDTTYTVTITDTVSGLTAVDSVHIDVKPVPSSDFNVVSPICSDLFSTINYTGTGSSASSFNWLFSGGSILSGTGAGPYTVSWPVSGTMFVSLEVTDSGCVSPVTYDSVVVQTTPVAGFVADDINGCAPHTVNFTDLSNPSGTIWNWILGDGSSSNIQNPSHTYTTPGLYDVTLAVESPEGCNDTLTYTNYIEVYEQPVANISADPLTTSIMDPEIIFSSNSMGVNDWFWNFGDPGSLGNNTSMLPPSVSHVYSADGHFLVMLVVTSANGCVDTAYINVEVIAEPSFYNIITPDGNGQNDVFEILNAERIPNELVVFNRWGKKVYEATNYQNDWDGGDLSDGTYYYIFIYGVELQNEYQGTLTIMRK